jgi:hypothetical protein
MGLVNFHNMPACASSACAARGTLPKLSCSTVNAPCPTGASAATGATNKDVSTNSNSGCPTVPLSCYCALPNPLLCAWTCGWYDWLLAENWFNTTCPGVPPIDFSPVPACARSCLHDRVFNYGCITLQKNCFCSQKSLFGCSGDCSTTENATVVDWYRKTCHVSLDEARKVADIMNKTGAALLETKHWRGFDWYEIFLIVVLSTSVGVFLCYVSYGRERIRKGYLATLSKGEKRKQHKE